MHRSTAVFLSKYGRFYSKYFFFLFFLFFFFICQTINSFTIHMTVCDHCIGKWAHLIFYGPTNNQCQSVNMPKQTNRLNKENEKWFWKCSWFRSSWIRCSHYARHRVYYNQSPFFTLCISHFVYVQLYNLYYSLFRKRVLFAISCCLPFWILSFVPPNDKWINFRFFFFLFFFFFFFWLSHRLYTNEKDRSNQIANDYLFQ